MTYPNALILTLALFVCSCTPTLYAVSTPPPMRTADLTSEQPLFAKRKHKVRISTGVALALNCSDGGPCKNPRATSDDPTVARVIPAHLNQLEHNYLAYDNNAPATFVLVGVRPGQTVVRVESDSGDTCIQVTVLE